MRLIRQLFCKHEFRKVGILRDGGFMDKLGKIDGGLIYHTCKCHKCEKRINVYIEEVEDEL